MRTLTSEEIKAISGGAEVKCTGFLWYLLTNQICCNAGEGPVCT